MFHIKRDGMYLKTIANDVFRTGNVWTTEVKDALLFEKLNKAEEIIQAIEGAYIFPNPQWLKKVMRNE